MTFDYKWTESDGGKKSSKNWHDDNDCTVRALAHAYDVPYDVAHTFLRRYGRKDKKGISFYMFVESGKMKYYFGGTVLKIPCSTTLQKTMETIGPGTFLWLRSRHVLCIKDGVVLDTYQSRPGARCIALWKIIKRPRK